MPISKRMRYEILRRDNHTCRYCGATAPEAKLTVDHVLPIALGGVDDATNLVAACSDCNAGKSSSNPDQPLVDQVSEDAIRWAAAIQRAASAVHTERAAVGEYVDAVLEAWNRWQLPRFNGPPQQLPLPSNARDSVEGFMRRGMPLEIMQECVDIGARADRIPPATRWKYGMGVAWRRITEIEDGARAIVLVDGEN